MHDDGPSRPPGQLIRNSTVEFLIFTAQDGGESIEARYEDETVWLTQRLMAELFGVDVRTVSEHLGNIYATGELEREATIRKIRMVRAEGSRRVERGIDHYNLDAIISVGYRVNSVRATQFRQWATRVLRDFALRGYVIDRKRMENGPFLGEDYFERLLEETACPSRFPPLDSSMVTAADPPGSFVGSSSPEPAERAQSPQRHPTARQFP
ncbi:MAG: RhuM family protein [Propionibacteriaceae bacterium]|nr:RhuM family protein [Propionibacteriaceae bacterium]